MDFPSLSDISRRWYRAPNADRIAAIERSFMQLRPFERDLFLIGLDIEEGVLPMIHPGGRVSRQRVVNDHRLLAGGGIHDYRVTIATSRARPSATPAASTPPTGSGAAAAKTTLATRPVEQLSQAVTLPVFRPMTGGEVLAEDMKAMEIWFPEYRLVSSAGRQLPHWSGTVAPFGPRWKSFALQAHYQSDLLAPLRMRVAQPALHPGAPHRYVGGDLCTFYPPLGSWLRGREGDDLVELMRFAITWLVRYACWITFPGWWPGVDIPHDPAFLLATLRDDDLCPYHSPRHWGECCKAEHLRAASPASEG